MGWSFKLGKIFGIDVKIHVSFLLIVLWGALAYGGNAGPLYGVLLVLSLFVLVFLHELGHSLAAMYYGIPVKDITLMILGGVARLERMPEKPVQELVIALAGPAVNVGLAAVLLPVVLFMGVAQGDGFTFEALTAPGLFGLLVSMLSANIVLAVFNMIPAFPLDGGRVFRAMLGFFTDYQAATRIASIVGRTLAVGLGLLAIFTGQIFLGLIAVFIFFVGGQEARAVAARGVLRGVPAGKIMNDNRTALSPEARIGDIAMMVMRSQQTAFAVLDSYSGELMGVVSQGSIARAMQQGLWHQHVVDLMDRDVPRVALTTSLDEVQQQLTSTSSRVVAVYEGMNFRGLISMDDVARAFHFLSQGGQQVRWGTT